MRVLEAVEGALPNKDSKPAMTPLVLRDESERFTAEQEDQNRQDRYTPNPYPSPDSALLAPTPNPNPDPSPDLALHPTYTLHTAFYTQHRHLTYAYVHYAMHRFRTSRHMTNAHAPHAATSTCTITPTAAAYALRDPHP